MYVDYFGLRELPFNNSPDPRFFFSTPDHEEALASLVYAVQARKGFVLLTGEVGAGKTLISRMMLRHFGAGIAFATINHAVQNAGDLMESVCAEFEIPFGPSASNAQLVRKLHDFLLARFAEDTSAVLVLDEAQTVPVDAFEQLRMIGNLEADDAKLLQIVILGQPELQQRFASPELRQLRQRVFRVFHLPAMDRRLTEGYVRHRLKIAGASNLGIFSDSAIDMVHQHAQGLPRLVNTLCDNALLSAYSANQPRIDGRAVDSVVAQMMTLHGSTLGSLATSWSSDLLVSPRSGYPGAQPRRPVATQYREPEEQRSQRATDRYGPSPYDGSVRTSGVPAPEPVAHSAEAPSIREELAQLKHVVATDVARLGRRMTGLEGESAGLHDTLEHARAVRDRLEPLLSGAADVIARAESSSAELARQETHTLKLATKIKAIVGESRRILDGIRQVAARSRRAERNARGISERLAAQTERLRNMCGAVARGLGPHERDDSVTASPPGLLRQASAPLGASGIAPDALRNVLTRSRESLSDFRSVTRKGADSESEVTSPAEDREARPADVDLDQPTARLAREVETLVDMISSDG